MNTVNTNKKAVQEGAQAKEDGKRLSDNPYKSETQANRRWTRGFVTQTGHNIINGSSVATEPEIVIEPVVTVKKTVPKTKTKAKDRVAAEKRTVSKPRKTVSKKKEN